MLQNHSNEGKGRKKGKSEEKERRIRKRSNSCTVTTSKIGFGRKNCWTQKVYLAIMLSIIRLDDPTKWAALMPNGLKPRLPHANGTFWQIGRILRKQWSREMSSIDGKWPETLSPTSKWHTGSYFSKELCQCVKVCHLHAADGVSKGFVN